MLVALGAVCGATTARAETYQQAMQRWQYAEDVNAWIGANFSYDLPRALQLSETQRRHTSTLQILQPDAFYTAPSGVCVDLSRFAVETLGRIDPAAAASYLMIEFEPVQLQGQTLRQHWLASFLRDGQHYFFADSERPGIIAGPYGSTRQFIEDYAAYRGRQIVRYRELPSYQRQPRAMAAKAERSVAQPIP
jgi:hypothetical protein